MKRFGIRVIFVSLFIVSFNFITKILVMQFSGYVEYSNKVINVIWPYGLSNEEMLKAIQEPGYEEAVYNGLAALTWPQVSNVGLLLGAALVIINALIKIGYESYCLLAIRGNAVTVRDVFNGFNFPIKGLLIRIVSGIEVALGLILFVAPGLIILFSHKMAIFVMFDNPDKGVIWCLKESARLMRGKKMDLFVLELSFIGWIIADWVISQFIAFPVVGIWLEPFRGMTRASFYDGIVVQNKAADEYNGEGGVEL